MSRIGKGGSRVRDFFRRIFHRNGHSQTFRSVDDLTADPNAAFHNAGLHSNGRNLSERAASSNDLLSQSPTPTTKDKPVNFKPEHDEYDWNHKRKPSPSRPRRSAHRKEHKKNPPAPPPRMKSKPKVEKSPPSSSSLSVVPHEDPTMREDATPIAATKESRPNGAESTSNFTAKPNSPKPRKLAEPAAGHKKSKFKDELAAKLSAGPMFGGRAPVPGSRPMFPSASSPPISPNSGAGASGDSARQRSLSAGAESSQENSSGQSEDPYMEVAMQRVALSRQRKHRMPTRYSGNPKASNLPPDSSAAANGGSGLNQISEEEEEDDADKDGKAHGRLKHDRCQNNRHSSNLNSRHSSSGARVDSSSDSDSSSVSSSEEDYFNRISKYPLREDREPASPCSAASSSSPCGQRLSYADRSEDDEEGVGGGAGTASRSPLTSSSGDGLFDSSEPIVRPRISLRPSSVRPSSMFVGGSLQEELWGIVQTRLSRIKSTTGEDQSVKLRPGPGPRPKQPHIRFRRSPPRTTNTADQGHGFGVVLRRTAQNASGATSTLETQHSSNSTSPSSGRRAVSMALTGLDDRPVRVHDLIKAFQRDSR